MVKLLQLLGQLSASLAGRIAAILFMTPMNQPKVTRGQAMLDQAEIVKIAHQGKSLRGYVWGHGEQTVILCHGWRASAGSMSAFVDPLLEKGFRVLAFDAPAHRDSPGRRVSLDSYGEAIQQAITQFTPVHAVIAHSFGAFSLTLLMDQEPALPIKYAVLIGCPRDITGVMGRFARYMQLSDSVAEQFYKTMYAKLKHEPLFYSAQRALRGTSIAGLLVHDRNDDVVPFRCFEALAQEWSGASRLVTDGLGHNDILRDPETVAKIADSVAVEVS